MRCPACERQTLTRMTVGDVSVDVCKGGCGGIWFDQHELRKLDEPHEHAGESLLDVDVSGYPGVDHNRRRNCPKCVGTIMLRHFYSVKHEVEVDECPVCGGVWLDDGELKTIRSLYSTEAERKQAAEAYFRDIFDAELARLRQQSQEKMAKAQKFANMFRFLCPSFYIPGKQGGGAF